MAGPRQLQSEVVPCDWKAMWAFKGIETERKGLEGKNSSPSKLNVGQA